MPLSTLLTPVVFDPSETPLVAVDAATRFAIVAAENGPERVDSAYRKILVPMHDWQVKGVNEDEEIVRTLTEASAMNPLKMPSPAAVDPTFWVKNRGWRAIFYNRAIRGKFFIPDGILSLMTPNVPADRLVLVGPAAMAGFYVKQGARRGVLSNCARGLLQVQFGA